MELEVVVLAAGKGTRMHSDRPKVLHRIGGRPMLEHVVDAAAGLGSPRLHIVIGHGADLVKLHFESRPGISWVIQEQQLGTGHAVQQAMPGIARAPDEGESDTLVLVLCGDVPLISTETLRDLVANAGPDTLALLTLVADNPAGLGRILRDRDKRVTGIVEEKDATEEQKALREINTGIMVLPAQHLRNWLARLRNDNRQGEYYLTDVIAMAVDEGREIYTHITTDPFEVMGVNDKAQLAMLERHYQQAQAQQLMKNGVTLADPARIDTRGRLVAGRDVSIDINCVFEGSVSLGNGVSIGPNVIIRDASIGDGSTVLSNTVIEGASVGRNCSVGPFARLRPGTRLGDRVRVGNYVEIKNSSLGEGSKANHLAYIGDAELGSGVNVGAGTIFCNYDGANKHRCEIGDDVFIGSNSTLVAPVSIASGAFVAAGSTINQNIASNELAVARGKQRNITGWKRPTKK